MCYAEVMVTWPNVVAWDFGDTDRWGVWRMVGVKRRSVHVAPWKRGDGARPCALHTFVDRTSAMLQFATCRSSIISRAWRSCDAERRRVAERANATGALL